MSNPEILVMLTGPRQVQFPDLVLSSITQVLSDLRDWRPISVLSGGAVGADTLLVQAADALGIAYDVEFPHPGYADHYGIAAESATLAQGARSIDYTVASGRFHWRQNLARNASMVRRADRHLVVHPDNPRTFGPRTKGGTANCFRSMRESLPVTQRIMWVPDRSPSSPMTITAG